MVTQTQKKRISKIGNIAIKIKNFLKTSSYPIDEKVIREKLNLTNSDFVAAARDGIKGGLFQKIGYKYANIGISEEAIRALDLEKFGVGDRLCHAVTGKVGVFVEPAQCPIPSCFIQYEGTLYPELANPSELRIIEKCLPTSHSSVESEDLKKELNYVDSSSTLPNSSRLTPMQARCLEIDIPESPSTQISEIITPQKESTSIQCQFPVLGHQEREVEPDCTTKNLDSGLKRSDVLEKESQDSLESPKETPQDLEEDTSSDEQLSQRAPRSHSTESDIFSRNTESCWYLPFKIVESLIKKLSGVLPSEDISSRKMEDKFLEDKDGGRDISSRKVNKEFLEDKEEDKFLEDKDGGRDISSRKVNKEFLEDKRDEDISSRKVNKEFLEDKEEDKFLEDKDGGKDISSRKMRRSKGEGSGCIYFRNVIKKGKKYFEAYYQYEIWSNASKGLLAKSTKYIPKRLLPQVQRLEAQKAPVKEILQKLQVSLTA